MRRQRGSTMPLSAVRADMMATRHKRKADFGDDIHATRHRPAREDSRRLQFATAIA